MTFVSKAHTDIPALIAEVRALHEANLKYQDERDHCEAENVRLRTALTSARSEMLERAATVMHHVSEAHRIYMFGVRGNAIEDHLMSALQGLSSLATLPLEPDGEKT